MAADHTLADRVLADQLERHAAQRFVGEPVSGMCRAAAVRLRKLDAIEEAAAAQGDADGLHLLADGLRGFRFTSSSANFIDRIADALGPGGE